jgi:GTP-binding protein HflX
MAAGSRDLPREWVVKGKLHDAEVRPPVAVLFGRAGRTGGEDVLDELAGLAEAADVGVAGRLIQNLQRPLSATYIGSGKVQELHEMVKACHAELVLADVDLSPAQARNLTKAVGVRVVDRSELIMDIFARRARTAQAKLQVELAQLKYMLPRLRGQWDHLDRYRGGGVGTRGPGEKQLETDRRLVNKRIGDLQARLEVYERRTQLNLAGRSSARKVALAGYTNTGKSTLFNRLTGADRLAVNRLFATLDTRTRKWPVPNCEELILSDTVGFVASLPHHLVASFHATLEEVVEADLLLHVVDVSSESAADQIASVNEVLKEIAADDKPTLMVFNKIDQIPGRNGNLHWLAEYPHAVCVSAQTGEGLDELQAELGIMLRPMRSCLELQVPASDGATLARIRALGQVDEERYEGDIVHLKARIPDHARAEFARFRVPE